MALAQVVDRWRCLTEYRVHACNTCLGTGSVWTQCLFSQHGGGYSGGGQIYAHGGSYRH